MGFRRPVCPAVVSSTSRPGRRGTATGTGRPASRPTRSLRGPPVKPHGVLGTSPAPGARRGPPVPRRVSRRPKAPQPHERGLGPPDVGGDGGRQSKVPKRPPSKALLVAGGREPREAHDPVRDDEGSKAAQRFPKRNPARSAVSPRNGRGWAATTAIRTDRNHAAPSTPPRVRTIGRTAKLTTPAAPTRTWPRRARTSDLLKRRPSRSRGGRRNQRAVGTPPRRSQRSRTASGP